MNSVPNLHGIEAIYFGPSNFRGSRVKLVSHRFGVSKWIDYDHSKKNIWDMAVAWLVSHGFDVVGMAETKRGYLLLSSTFKSLSDA